RIDLRPAVVVNAVGPAAEDQARGMALLQLGPGSRARHELAVNVGLAHAPRDQLAELRAEVEDEDRLLARVLLDFFPPRRGGRHRGPREFKAKPRNSRGLVSSCPSPRAAPAGTPCPRR